MPSQKALMLTGNNTRFGLDQTVPFKTPARAACLSRPPPLRAALAAGIFPFQECHLVGCPVAIPAEPLATQPR